MDAEAVEGARPDLGHITVPDLVAVLRQLDAGGLLLARLVEQAHLDLSGVGGEDGEIDPFAVPGCSLGIRQAFLDGRELYFGGRVHVEQTTERKRRAA